MRWVLGHADAPGEAAFGRLATARAEIDLQRGTRLRTCSGAFSQASFGLRCHHRTTRAATTSRGRLENFYATTASGGDIGNRFGLGSFHRHVLRRVRQHRPVRHERYSSRCAEQAVVLNPKGSRWFREAVVGDDQRDVGCLGKGAAANWKIRVDPCVFPKSGAPQTIGRFDAFV